jgi:hypothetical protein
VLQSPSPSLGEGFRVRAKMKRYTAAMDNSASKSLSQLGRGI